LEDLYLLKGESPMNRTLKIGALTVALLLALLAVSLPTPARACLWGVQVTDYYSTGGTCFTDCYNQKTCWGDTSGYIIDSGWGECWYC
jgi:hypothetical protein